MSTLPSPLRSLSLSLEWPHQKTKKPVGAVIYKQEMGHNIPKSFLRTLVSVVLGRMKFTLHATRRTPHGASRLVQAMPAWLVKTRRAPSRHSRDARVLWSYGYGHAQTEYPLPLQPLPTKPQLRNSCVRLDSILGPIGGFGLSPLTQHFPILCLGLFRFSRVELTIYIFRHHGSNYIGLTFPGEA